MIQSQKDYLWLCARQCDKMFPAYNLRYRPLAFYIFLGFTILWFLFMTYLSHQNGEHTGMASRELAEKLSALDFLGSEMNILNGRLRRLAHVVVYAVLAVLLAITLKLGGHSPWLTAGIIVWAWADEATKPLVQGRHFSWFDVGLNVLGIVIGMVIVVVIF